MKGFKIKGYVARDKDDTLWFHYAFSFVNLVAETSFKTLLGGSIVIGL